MQLIAARDPRLYAEYQRMLGFYEHYKLGHLPAQGALLDQNARFVAWMQAIAKSDAQTQKAFMSRDETARREQEKALADTKREHRSLHEQEE